MNLLDWFFSFSTAHNFNFGFSNEVTLTSAFDTTTSHKFLRDTRSRGANPFARQGHNNLVGHMNGGWPKFIYQDCRCLCDDLSSPIPMHSLITSEKLKQAHLTEDDLTNLCKKNISNAFENVPFGALKYG